MILTIKIWWFFIHQDIMENDSVEKTRKNNSDFVGNKAKTCYQANNEKIRKRSLEYYRKLS